MWGDDKSCRTYKSCSFPQFNIKGDPFYGSNNAPKTYIYRRKVTSQERFPAIPGLVLDLRKTDYDGGTHWYARTGPSAIIVGKPVFTTKNGFYFRQSLHQYATVAMNTDGFDMPFCTYSIWLKLPKAIGSACRGWAMSQSPDHGWSRSITLNDPRLSKTSGVSISSRTLWKNTLPKPPVNKWFHVVASWADELGTQYGCVYLNGQKGLCVKGTNGKHAKQKETLVIGSHGMDADKRHKPDVMVGDVRVYKSTLTQEHAQALYDSGQHGINSGWTTILKTNGDATFGYDSEHWTSSKSVLNETSPTSAPGNAKYSAFNQQDFDKIRICVGSLNTCHTYRLDKLYRDGVQLFGGRYLKVAASEVERA